MRRLALMVVLVVSVVVPGGGAALADHDHDLVTPGTTVVDIANGQTEKCAVTPGGHQYHAHVHKGTPGTAAFERPNNPVSVDKSENATC